MHKKLDNMIKKMEAYDTDAIIAKVNKEREAELLDMVFSGQEK